MGRQFVERKNGDVAWRGRGNRIAGPTVNMAEGVVVEVVDPQPPLNLEARERAFNSGLAKGRKDAIEGLKGLLCVRGYPVGGDNITGIVEGVCAYLSTPTPAAPEVGLAQALRLLADRVEREQGDRPTVEALERELEGLTEELNAANALLALREAEVASLQQFKDNLTALLGGGK